MSISSALLVMVASCLGDIASSTASIEQLKTIFSVHFGISLQVVRPFTPPQWKNGETIIAHHQPC